MSLGNPTKLILTYRSIVGIKTHVTYVMHSPLYVKNVRSLSGVLFHVKHRKLLSEYYLKAVHSP